MSSNGAPTKTPADILKEKDTQFKYLDEQLSSAQKQVDAKLSNDIAIMKAKAEVRYGFLFDSFRKKINGVFEHRW